MLRSLHSVAIYGDNAMARYLRISNRSTLFGYPVRGASLEMGVRPFVDVRFAG